MIYSMAVWWRVNILLAPSSPSWDTVPLTADNTCTSVQYMMYGSMVEGKHIAATRALSSPSWDTVPLTADNTCTVYSMMYGSMVEG